MKILNNRVVCSGCEEPFEVGQKMMGFIKGPVTITGMLLFARVQGFPTTTEEEAIQNEEIFHEGCD